MNNNFKTNSEIGFGLIEVLVTLVILSISLLALAALQTRSLQFNQGAYLRSQANIYAYDILDRMRLNVDLLAEYESPSVPFPLSTAEVTTPIAAADLNAWRRSIATNLPNGEGGIECIDSDPNLCTVTITWDEINGSGEPSENKTQFSYTARL